MEKMVSVLKKVGKGVAFVLIFLALGEMLMSVMIFKQEDGTLPVHNYYSLPRDTVDVLVLGTSHAGMNVSTKTMWDEYGIAGYRFWGSIQPIWNTYYYLLEALKYQSPKVVLLDAHSVTFQQEYGPYPVQVKNTIAMRLSKEKVENIWASVPQGERAFMLFGFPTYHNRYNQLTQEDFEYFPWDSHKEIQVLSSETTEAIYSFNILDKDTTEGEIDLGEKEEKYLRMLLSYCKEHQIHLEIVASPYEITAIEQQKYRRVRSIAAEYGFDFTNFNECYQDYGIDPQQDFLDPGHFNKTGMPKYARALAELLKSKYDLPDRRQDPSHIWNQVRAKVNDPVFALTEQQVLDGRQDYYDTGIKLYENPLASWTLMAEFTVPDAGSESHVPLACYDSKQDGLRISREPNGDLEIRFAKDMTARIQRPTDSIRLCLIKMGQKIKLYVNDELIEDRKIDMDALTQYNGTLMLGCEMGANGRRTHFGKTTVRDLVVYDTALNETDALAWTARSLPVAEKTEYMKAVTREDLLLSLQNRFEGDGEAYVDTGVKLFEDPEASFTLLSQIELTGGSGDMVYFSCFSEEPGAYRGLLVRKIGTDTLNVMYGDAYGLNLPLSQGDEPAVLAIAKDRSAYTIYLNGEKVLDQDVSVCEAYGGSFLIGCQEDANGDLFRFSNTTVYNLEVYAGLMTEEQILSWHPSPLAAAYKAPGMDVSYILKESFAGNKKNACVDTGIMLYDNAEKDWTITFLLDRVTVRRGSVLSCFDETPGKYRGLLLRQTDETHFSFVLGAEYADVEIHPADQAVITLVKNQNHYQIYVDGELRAEADSKIASYLGNLYIGCERDQNGRPFRFSDISVRRLEIVSRAMNGDEVRNEALSWKEDGK